jgi:glyoxylase-like metal-dependent hydrolase (beta-lactamase superfamily II)
MTDYRTKWFQLVAIVFCCNGLRAADVSVINGPVNGVLIHRGGKTLAVYGDPRAKPEKVEKVLFTHARRDVVWAGRVMVANGAEAVVPEQEKQFFTDPGQFWEHYWTARFHDYHPQTSRVPVEAIRNAKTVRGGDHIEWEGLTIEVLDTPGYTTGAVSYLFEADGKRIACVGDLIYGDGRILDLYSLQDAIPAAKEDGYHGYAARAAELIGSLRKIGARNPDQLIPARGPVIDHPREAIQKLIDRLQAVMISHYSIDALRWYRGEEKMDIQQRRILGGIPVKPMRMAETHEKPPEWIVPISNSRLILSESGNAFLVDCGSRRILDEIKKLQQAGKFQKLEGIYLTHYHDDHTDMAAAAQNEFHCPVYTSAEMQDILEHPGAYRMPCLTSNPIRTTVYKEGEKRRWHEYEFTLSYFPGQTLLHDGLLVKKDGGESVFFVGDSFTPTGMDDYCLFNRNLFEPEKGFLYCMDVLKRTKPDLLINQHVLPTFRFSDSQLDSMIDNWRKRRELLRDLFPWDDVNFGVDDQWARFYPYGTESPAGRPIELKIMVLNHSAEEKDFRITPHAPAAWKISGASQRVKIPPRQERAVSFTVTPPAGQHGVGVVTADIAFGAWDLREWAEALVKVE